MKIGAMVESFRLDVEGGLNAAAELKVDGVQLYAVRGEMHPNNITSKCRSVKARFRLNLTWPLCGKRVMTVI